METEMTLQDLFNKIWAGMKSQNFERASDGYKYRYHLGNKKCPIGYIIPQNIYSEAMEGLGIRELVRYLRLCGSISLAALFAKYSSELQLLQSVHDNNASSIDIKAKLKMFASKNRLSIPE